MFLIFADDVMNLTVTADRKCDKENKFSMFSQAKCLKQADNEGNSQSFCFGPSKENQKLIACVDGDGSSQDTYEINLSVDFKKLEWVNTQIIKK